jgi:hypothetical protein
MHCLFTGLMFFTAAVAEPTPAAMVLCVEGDVAMMPGGSGLRRTACVMDLLYSHGQLITAPWSSATLVFLHDGHREWIHASGCTTIACGGCTPACVIEAQRVIVPAIAAEGTAIRPLARSGRGAAVVFR